MAPFQMDGLSRTARLRILGNGVVPQQAALAFDILSERAIKRMVDSKTQLRKLSWKK